MKQPITEVISISAEDELTRACFIPSRGGIGASITMPYQGQARELLYQHAFFNEPNWSDLPGGWPFLFPICARLKHNGVLGQYAWQAQTYQLPIHGLAWWQAWQVVDTPTRDTLIMALEHNDTTLMHYPFAFRVTLEYHVSPGTLQCKQHYTNLSATPMPYYAGFHPYFLLPTLNDKQTATIQFFPEKRLRYNADLTDVCGEYELFTLPKTLNDQALNEQLFLLGNDRAIHLNFNDGFALTLNTTHREYPALFPYLQLYTMADKPFFCVEPWMGYPNALNRLQGLRWLAPGMTETGLLTLSAQLLPQP